MNKIKNILILLAVCLTTLANAQKIQKEYFTTIDKLFYVEIGMTSNEVRSTLGVDPFDFYQNLAEGEMIVEYRYLHKKLQIKSKDNNYVKSNGEDYFTDASSIYFTFDTDKKLLAFYTDSGSENSEEAYIWENTIKQANTNPDCSNTCIIVTKNNNEEPKELIEESKKTKPKKKKKLFRK